ncbi:hypothetical protein ACGFNU_05725 [Spirillospora sp. NPDC048911]|uniref:hypothetical protein n=1 Tax=Spirillospora sp. NPDC048911 TaxID=3364527 RepID=UPI0037213DCC
MTDKPIHHPFRLSHAQADIAAEYAHRLARRLSAYPSVTATVFRSPQGPPEVSVRVQITSGKVLVGLRVHVWPRHDNGDLSWYRERRARGCVRTYFQYVRLLAEAELDPLAADLVGSLQRRAAATAAGAQS